MKLQRSSLRKIPLTEECSDTIPQSIQNPSSAIQAVSSAYFYSFHHYHFMWR